MKQTPLRERLVHLYERSRAYRHAESRRAWDIITALATAGLTAQCAPADRLALVGQKLNLDLAYLDTSAVGIDLSSLWATIETLGAVSRKRRAWVERIQIAHDISGLEYGRMTIDNDAYYPLVDAEDLSLIPSDLDRLRESKVPFYTWTQYCALTSGRTTLWRDITPKGTYQGVWEKVDVAVMNAALPFYDWCDVYQEDNGHIRIRLGRSLDLIGADAPCINFCYTAGDRPTW